MSRKNYQSGSGQYHHLYKHSAYRRRRRLYIKHNPLCVRCKEKGISVPATIVDHVVPHKGDLTLLLRGELQSLCDNCHSAGKQYEEHHGYRRDVGIDGWPIDERHPVHRSRKHARIR
jgi:5-methylcytosine-specific restriction endonuclease McrA